MPNPSSMPSVMGFVPQKAVLGEMPEVAISWAVLRLIPAAADELVAGELPPGDPTLLDDELLEQAARASAQASAAAADSVFLHLLARMLNVITGSSI
jgi:hypothetical protein